MKRGVLFLAVMLLAVSSCAKAPETHSTVVSGYEEAEGHITGKIGDKIVIDANVLTSPERETYELLKGTWDDENHKDVYDAFAFSMEEEVIEEVNTLRSGAVDYICYLSSDGTPAEINCNYGYTYNAGSGRFSYYNDFFTAEIDYSMVQYLCGYPNEMVMWIPMPEEPVESLPDEIEGFPREEAVRTVKETLDGLGLSVMEMPRVCLAVSKKTFPKEAEEALRELQEMYPNDYQKYYQEDDHDFYYMLWQYTINDTPFEYGNRTSAKSENFAVREAPDNGAVLAVIVDETGIRYISSDEGYRVTGREEAKPVLSLEQAVEKIPDFYNDRMISEVRTVYSASFCYTPKATEKITNDAGGTINYRFDLIPCWVFEVSYDRSDRPGLYRDLIHVNAHTGEFLQ